MCINNVLPLSTEYIHFICVLFFVAKTLRNEIKNELTHIHWRESVTTCLVSPINCFHLGTFLNKKKL